jgi:uncharacterized protein (DUF2267 family)
MQSADTRRPPRALTGVNARAPAHAMLAVAETQLGEGLSMTATGVPTLDHAPQVFAQWLGELCDDLGWTQKPRAYLLLHTTLHAVRDFLPANEAADLAAQLPVLVRGVFYEGWTPAKTPVKPRNKADFLGRVDAHFQDEPLEDTERAVAAVLDLLRRHVSAGELEQVRHAMRKPIQELWA